MAKSIQSTLSEQIYNPLVKYKVTPDGEIQTINPPVRNGGSNDRRLGYQASPPEVDYYLRRVTDYPYGSLEEAKSASAEVKQDKKLGALRLEFDKKLNEVRSRENTYNFLSDQNYNSEFTADMIKDPAAPTKKATLSKEDFFYNVFKPSIGGDGGLLSFFPSGGRGPGNVDGSPRVPNYNQFVAGSSTFSHRHDGKVYNMSATQNTGKIFNDAYENYKTNLEAENVSAQKNYETELGYSTAARGLANITNTSRVNLGPVNQAVAGLSAARNYGASDYASKLNFQVSDEQILQDLNAAKISKLNNVVNAGNAQIVGIRQRIDDASKLVESLKVGDVRRTTAEKAIASMTSDLNSVNQAISEANNQIKNYKPLTASDEMGLKDIVAFREFIQLPEERASQQLYQIDPESYRTAVALGQQYRQMATEPIGETKSAQAEQLRSNLEQEAINQLALGSQLGAEEQRQYQQAARAAQTARGNIFGVAPAVEEAVTTGLAGEQRKLARYGAASQFLASGQNTSDALKSDIAFRDALLQNRLGAASGFVAGGPSIYNLTGARTAQQQNAMQNYIQANQALPGGFNQQPSTASNFYQTVDPSIPVALQNAFTSLYGSQANYLANTYAANVGAISRQQSGAQQFASIAGGIGSIGGALAPGGLFGGPSSGAFFRG